MTTTPGAELAATGPAGGGGPARRHLRPPVVLWLVAVIAVILAGWALTALAIVVVPFVTAFFLALAVAPVDAFVRHRLPRRIAWLGHVVALLVVVAVMTVFLAGIYLAADSAVRALPAGDGALATLLPGSAGEGSAGEEAGERGSAPNDGQDADAAGGGRSGGLSDAAGAIGRSLDSLDLAGLDLSDLRRQAVQFAAENVGSLARAILNAAAGLASGLVVVIFLVLLMLTEAGQWRRKVLAALGHRTSAGWEDSVAAMARSFRWYLLVRVVIGLLTGALYVAWLYLMGVDLLLVWFVLALLLSLIPTIGSVIAGVLPVLYVLATGDLETAAFVAVGIIAIEQVTGNWLDPWLTGRQLAVSPLVTFFALLLFAWMWGAVGALLAVPMVVLAVILCAHVDALRPIALLLSDAETMDELDEKTSARSDQVGST